jgi:NTE family protein
MNARHPSQESFSLVLGGGGARGYAHLGALRTLEAWGYRPSAIVGVSMGALVAAAYSLRPDWYDAVLSADTSGFPNPGHRGRQRRPESARVRETIERARVVWNMMTGWGAPDRAVAAGRRLLEDLFGDKRLEEGRVPVVACATDLLSGARVELSSGLARDAVYASAALAGVIPPLEMGDYLLVDGVYTDISPVDVARAMDPRVVIAVDPTQPAGATDIHNGIQAAMRAVEICHDRHAALRFREADLVISPQFPTYVDTLDFESRRMCVLAGMRATREAASEIHDLLRPARGGLGGRKP